MIARKGTRRMTISERPALILLLAGLSAVLVWSGIHPRDTFTWFLEVLPALLGVGILAATYPRFRFSLLVYVLVSLHAIILMVGGHYTYAEMPAFNWLRDTFGLNTSGIALALTYLERIEQLERRLRELESQLPR